MTGTTGGENVDLPELVSDPRHVLLTAALDPWAKVEYTDEEGNYDPYIRVLTAGELATRALRVMRDNPSAFGRRPSDGE